MTTIIRMWSGPRNLSTALLRSWGNRRDTAVLDEPLYAHYLAETGLDHPAAAQTIAAGPRRFCDAIELCQNPPLGDGETVSYQKHMAHHLLPGKDTAWIEGAVNILLVRHPRRVIASYARVREQPTLKDLAFPQLVDIMDRFGPIPVIEADTFLANPERELRRVCRYADLPFDPMMLKWPTGTRPTDGAWASHWYDSVVASSGFAAGPTDDPASVWLPEELEPLAARALPLFEMLVEV